MRLRLAVPDQWVARHLTVSPDGADGIGYVFVCSDEHDARFLWQC